MVSFSNHEGVSECRPPIAKPELIPAPSARAKLHPRSLSTAGRDERPVDVTEAVVARLGFSPATGRLLLPPLLGCVPYSFVAVRVGRLMMPRLPFSEALDALRSRFHGRDRQIPGSRWLSGASARAGDRMMAPRPTPARYTALSSP